MLWREVTHSEDFPKQPPTTQNQIKLAEGPGFRHDISLILNSTFFGKALYINSIARILFEAKQESTLLAKKLLTYIELLKSAPKT